MPSRAYTSFLRQQQKRNIPVRYQSVNALSGLYLISTWHPEILTTNATGVSMPSRAYTSFLRCWESEKNLFDDVSMPSRAYTSFLRMTLELSCLGWKRCQCPLGLIPHFYTMDMVRRMQKLHDIVSMPSRAYTSFLRYPFKNLGFMRFPEPVFAGIYQNILTTAVFHAC